MVQNTCTIYFLRHNYCLFATMYSNQKTKVGITWPFLIFKCTVLYIQYTITTKIQYKNITLHPKNSIYYIRNLLLHTTKSSNKSLIYNATSMD